MNWLNILKSFCLEKVQIIEQDKNTNEDVCEIMSQVSEKPIPIINTVQNQPMAALKTNQEQFKSPILFEIEVIDENSLSEKESQFVPNTLNMNSIERTEINNDSTPMIESEEESESDDGEIIFAQLKVKISTELRSNFILN